jgi:transcriptional regulator, XRE family
MITSKIGNRIRELRKKEGISQEKLAFKADLDRTYIAGVESGKRNVSVKTLKKILDALGITLIIFIIVFPLFNILKKKRPVQVFRRLV